MTRPDTAERMRRCVAINDALSLNLVCDAPEWATMDCPVDWPWALDVGVKRAAQLGVLMCADGEREALADQLAEWYDNPTSTVTEWIDEAVAIIEG